MQDERKTKTQLVRELRTVRAKLERLKTSNEKRKHLIDKLREGERKYRLLMEHAGAGVGYYDTNGRLLMMNGLGVAALRKRPDEVVGKSMLELFGEDRGSVYLKRMRDVAATGEKQQFEDFVELPSGDRWFVSSFALIKADDDTIEGVQIISQDITERKHTEEALQESEERFRRLTDAAFEGILIHEGGVALSANDQFCKMFGYEVDELLGKQVIPLTVAAEARGAMARQIALGGAGPYESIGLKKDGTSFPMEIRARETEREGRKIRVATVLDISERKRAEEALHESEALHRVTMEHLLDPVFITDDHGAFTFVCANVLQILGYTEEDIKAMGNVSGLVGDHLFDFNELTNLDEIKNIERVMKDKRGRERTYLITVRRVSIKGGTILYVCRDVTERKQMEDALRESEERYRRLADNFPNGTASVYDKNLRLTFVAGSEMKKYGAKAENFIGKHFTEVAPPETFAIAEPHLRAAFEGQTSTYEAPYWEGRFYYVSVAPLHHADGTVNEILVVSQDITERNRAETDLKNMFEWQEAIFEGSRDAIFIADSEDHFVAVNKSACNLTGYSREELLKMRIPDLHEEEDLAAYAKFRDRIMAGVPILSEARIKRKDSTKIDTEFSNSLVVIAGIRYMHTIARDITERKREEEIIGDERNLLRSIINAIPDEIVVKDMERKFVLANVGCLHALGKQTLDQVVGLRDEDLIPERFVRDVREKENLVLRSGRTLFNDIPEPRRNPDTGELERVIMSTKTPLHDRSGRIVGLVTVNRNVTDWQRTLENLHRSEIRFRTIWDHSLDAMRLTDAKGTILMVNQSFCQLFKKESGELVGRSLADTYLPKSDENIVEDYCVRFRNRTMEPFLEAAVTIWSGEELFVEISNTLLPIPGQSELLLSVFHDITERKRAEEALRESEERYRDLIEHSHDLICTHDMEGNLLSVNRVATKLTGFTEEELVGKNVREFLGPEGRRLFKSYLARIQTTGSASGLLPVITKSGERRIWEYFNTLRTAGVTAPVVRGLARDITEQKRMEEALRESEAKLKAVFEVLPIGVCILDAERKVSYSNPALEGILDISRERLLNGGYQNRTYLRRDRTPMPAEEFASVRAINEQRVIRNVETGIVKEDGKVVWTSVSAVPVAFPDWKVVVVTADMTERRQAEERLVTSQEQLHMLAGHLQSVREEERKHLSQEFHDQLGQVLTAIKMDLSMMHRKIMDPGKELSRSVMSMGIESMQDMIDRAIGIIREIMSELRPEMLDQLGIVPTLEWEVERFRRQSGLSCTFHSSVEEIALKPKEAIVLYRIFQEAITNVARHAKATSVEVTLRKEGSELVLVIVDNGKGISAEAQQKTHSFGLIGMRERAILLGGSLEIRGVDEMGTTIVVRIPYKETRADGGSAL